MKIKAILVAMFVFTVSSQGVALSECYQAYFDSNVLEAFNNSCDEETTVADAEEAFDGLISDAAKTCKNDSDEAKTEYILEVIAQKKACVGVQE